MDRKNIFAVALSFSLVWHFVGAQAVHIIWPEDLEKRSFPEINFWGGKLLKEVNPESGQFSGQPVEVKITEKEAIPLSELSVKQEYDLELGKQGAEEFKVTESVGPGLDRAVMVKPDLPEYPEWAKELGSYFEMELKFLISADGTVSAVEKIKSAGYPELDEIGIRYIRQWKFMPLAEGSEESEQWGVVKLVFNLK